MPDTCRSCQASVIFVPSAKSGKVMILDAKPEKRVVLQPRGPLTGPELTARPDLPETVARVIDTYVDHHATCPAAASWKGRTRTGAP